MSPAADNSPYIPHLEDAAGEAVARLRFAIDCMFIEDAANHYEGWDQTILRDQLEYVARLLEQSREKSLRGSRET